LNKNQTRKGNHMETNFSDTFCGQAVTKDLPSCEIRKK